jgi:hypothetical protein
MAGTLTPHMATRQAVELIEDDWRELCEGVLITLAPGAQKPADLTRGRLRL